MKNKLNKEYLEEWFKKHIEQEVSEGTEINLSNLISSYELDSLSLVTIAHELEKDFEIDIDPTIFSEFETFSDVITWILQNKI